MEGLRGVGKERGERVEGIYDAVKKKKALRFKTFLAL